MNKKNSKKIILKKCVTFLLSFQCESHRLTLVAVQRFRLNRLLSSIPSLSSFSVSISMYQWIRERIAFATQICSLNQLVWAWISRQIRTNEIFCGFLYDRTNILDLYTGSRVCLSIYGWWICLLTQKKWSIFLYSNPECVDYVCSLRKCVCFGWKAFIFVYSVFCTNVFAK